MLLTVVPVHGLFWSGLMTASAAYLVDQIPESRRAEGLAYWGLAIVAAIAVAPPLAFWLYQWGWLWICIASGVANLLMATIAFAVLDREDQSYQSDDTDHRGGAGLIEWRVMGVSLTLFLFTFGYGGITSFIALYAESNGEPRGVYFTVLALVILVTRPVLGRVADRIGHKKVLLPCLVLMAIGLGLLVPGGSLPWLLASAVVFGLGLGSAFPVYSAYVNAARLDRAPRCSVRGNARRLRHRHRHRLDRLGLRHRDRRLRDRLRHRRGPGYAGASLLPRDGEKAS